MTLRRRLEMLTGGPARPFPLTVKDAHSLACALDDYVSSIEAEPLPVGGDAEADAQRIARLRELGRRLYLHAGFDRLAREREAQT